MNSLPCSPVPELRSASSRAGRACSPALRARLGEIPTDRQIAVYCQVGQRGYLATRILRQRGVNAVNVGGGAVYDGYYDGYYGPFYDGYWANDGAYYYSGAEGRPFVRDDSHHFHRAAQIHIARNGRILRIYLAENPASALGLLGLDPCYRAENAGENKNQKQKAALSHEGRSRNKRHFLSFCL